MVYTCLSGDYDCFDGHRYNLDDKIADYICFTDNKNLLEQKRVGCFEVHLLVYKGRNNTYTNRYHKIMAHILFPNYSWSIYLDANICILTDKLFRQIDFSKILMISKHSERNCIYDKAETVIKLNLSNKQIVQKAMDYMKQQHFPAQMGLFDNSIIYRKNNHPKIIMIMNEWWDMLNRFACRDQLYLNYICFKHKLLVEDIYMPSCRINTNDFIFKNHTGVRNG